MSQGKSTSKGVKNDTRRNGKAAKKNPGVSPKANNGKTKDGYTPEAVSARAATRINAAAKAVTAS